MKRIPFVKRTPMTLQDLRKPIIIEDYGWYDVYKFEGVYEINLYGQIRKYREETYIKDYNGIVILRHPHGDGSSLCCSICDVWASTFLDDDALDNYSYMNSIKRK